MKLGLLGLARTARDDASFALRLMRRAPRFFVALILIAGVGVGATTAMASLVEAALLRPPPFPNSERVVVLSSVRPNNELDTVSLPDLRDWQQAPSIERLATRHDWAFGIPAPDGTTFMELGSLVSGDYFPILGVQPLLGRLLRPEDDAPGEPCRVVLSEELFRRNYGSDASRIGRELELDGKPCTLVGVAQPDFHFSFARGRPMALWATIGKVYPEYEGNLREARDATEFEVLGRLRPGASLASANAELAAISVRGAREHPEHTLRARVATLHEEDISELRPKVLGLFAAIGTLFVGACANIAGLFLVRAQARRGELALRSALGATRSRLTRQLLTELGVVFLLAAPAGWLGAYWFIALFTSITGVAGAPVAVNHRVLFFSLLLSSATGLLFGLGPSLAMSRQPLGSALIEAGSGAPRSGQRLRSVLIVLQIAAACALATSSGIAFRGVAGLLQTPGGFETAGLVAIRINPPPSLFSEGALPGLFDKLFEQLRTRPGVRAVTASSGVPLRGQYFEAGFRRVRRELPPAPAENAIMNAILPGYLEVLEIPLLRGREFDSADFEPGAEHVALISEALRARFFRDEDPIGQWIDHNLLGNTAPAKIIGVVGDVHRFGLQAAAPSEIYVPYGQVIIRSMDVIVRFAPEQADGAAQQLSGWLRQFEPKLPVWRAVVQTGRFELSVQPEQRLALLLGAFASASLIFAGLGLYAAVSYAAAQRTREYGIRAALGASPWNIAWLVTASAVLWISCGLALALSAVLAFGGLLSRQIAGAPAFEARSFLLAAAMVSGVALIACIGPALRAIRQAPAAALRQQ